MKKNIHGNKDEEANEPSTTSSQPSTSATQPRTYRNRQTKKQPLPRIFDFDSDPKLSALRDEAIAEQAKWRERKEAELKTARDERRQAIQKRKRTLAERNKLAEENERVRKEREQEKRDLMIPNPALDRKLLFLCFLKIRFA